MKAVKQYQPGDKLYVLDEESGRKPKKESVTVIQKHEHFVLVENKFGIRTCITNAELYGRMYKDAIKKSGIEFMMDKDAQLVEVQEEKRKFPAFISGGKGR